MDLCEICREGFRELEVIFLEYKGILGILEESFGGFSREIEFSGLNDIEKYTRDVVDFVAELFVVSCIVTTF